MFPNTSQTLSEYGSARFVSQNSTANGTSHSRQTIDDEKHLHTAVISIGVSLGVSLLVMTALLIRQWVRTRSLSLELKEIKESRVAGTARITGQSSQAVSVVEIAHERTARGEINQGLELSSEAAVNELPFDTKRQELQG